MCRLFLLLACLAAPVPLLATDGPFPTPAPVPAPPPPPVPAPAGTVLTLTPDLLYVFSDGAADLVAQPAGLVTVTKTAGPITFKGKFAGGTGGVETRTLTGPFVYSVEPVAGASGRVHLALVREGRKLGDPIPMTIVDVGAATPPPPQPKPVDPPAPKPDATRGIWVIVVQDESVAAPASLTGATITKLVASGRGHIYGSSRDAAKIAAKKYDALLEEAEVRGSGLIVLDKTGAKVLVVPLPTTDADLASKLRGVVPGV